MGRQTTNTLNMSESTGFSALPVNPQLVHQQRASQLNTYLLKRQRDNGPFQKLDIRFPSRLKATRKVNVSIPPGVRGMISAELLQINHAQGMCLYHEDQQTMTLPPTLVSSGEVCETFSFLLVYLRVAKRNRNILQTPRGIHQLKMKFQCGCNWPMDFPHSPVDCVMHGTWECEWEFRVVGNNDVEGDFNHWIQICPSTDLQKAHGRVGDIQTLYSTAQISQFAMTPVNIAGQSIICAKLWEQTSPDVNWDEFLDNFLTVPADDLPEVQPATSQPTLEFPFT